MEKVIEMPEKVPGQHQDRQPGIESKMEPRPIYDNDAPGYNRLKGKVAIITGGDSGIGRAVAIQFAKEGADVAIVYLNEHEDAEETSEAIKKYGKEALLLSTDISIEENCKHVVEETLKKFGQIDIVVNNAAVQYEQHDITDITGEQWEHTF